MFETDRIEHEEDMETRAKLKLNISELLFATMMSLGLGTTAEYTTMLHLNPCLSLYIQHVCTASLHPTLRKLENIDNEKIYKMGVMAYLRPSHDDLSSDPDDTTRVHEEDDGDEEDEKSMDDDDSKRIQALDTSAPVVSSSVVVANTNAVNVVSGDSSRLFGAAVPVFAYNKDNDPVGHMIRVGNRYFWWVFLRFQVIRRCEYVCIHLADEKHADNIKRTLRGELVKLSAAACESEAVALAWRMLTPAGLIQDCKDRAPTVKFSKITGHDTFKRSIPSHTHLTCVNDEMLKKTSDADPLDYMYDTNHPFHEAWMLVMWDKQFISATGISFLEHYTVLDYELFDKRSLLYRKTREHDVRRPLLVQIGHEWFVQFTSWGDITTPIPDAKVHPDLSGILSSSYTLCEPWVVQQSLFVDDTVTNQALSRLEQGAFPFTVVKCAGLYNALTEWLKIAKHCFSNRLESGKRLDRFN